MNQKNALRIIQEAIAKNQITLNLSNNQLTKLPVEIGNLINLMWLSLKGNQIPFLSDGLESSFEPITMIHSYLSLIDEES